MRIRNTYLKARGTWGVGGRCYILIYDVLPKLPGPLGMLHAGRGRSLSVARCYYPNTNAIIYASSSDGVKVTGSVCLLKGAQIWDGSLGSRLRNSSACIPQYTRMQSQAHVYRYIAL